ncbi:MAG: GNAT family N-acetyltransferase [Lachnospiraceae bacterium]|nr:GNAT family N-acetyltransferase [Lachnospiraceae bacterium]
MDIVRIKKEELKYFSGLAPVEALGIMTLPNAAAIGAVEKHDAAGLLLFTKQGEESITIEWLYVDELFRGTGVGGMLMETIFDIARQLKVKRVCARLIQDELFEAWQIYLMQWGFSWRKTLPGEWNITAEELLSVPLSTSSIKMKDELRHIRPLSKVASGDLARAVKNAENEGESILYDVIGDGRYLDPELSVVYMKDEKITGMLLIHKSANIVYPAVFWAEGRDRSVMSALVEGSLKFGEKNLKDHDMIRITASDDDLYGFERELLANIPGIRENTVYMMQASPNAPYESGEEDTELKDLFMPADIPTGGFTVTDIEVR